jgi:hypothetical protein
MSGFKVSIVNGQVLILSEDIVPETDIIDLLQFNESMLEDLYQNHAAVQARWEQVAINLRNEFERFDEEFAKKWWAHNKRFAKLSLEGSGEKKPTVDLIRDTAILIYSVDTSEAERDKYVYWAQQEAARKKEFDLGGDFKSFMLKYILQNPAWYFETLTSTLKGMERNVLTLANICKRLESRSFHMKELNALMQAKSSNIGPQYSYAESRNQQRLMESIATGNYGGK